MLRRIQNKISKTRDYIAYLKEISPDCHQKIARDKMYQGAFLHYLFLLESILTTNILLKDSDKSFRLNFETRAYHRVLDYKHFKKMIELQGEKTGVVL